MASIEKSIEINKPVDAVFGFLEDPTNLLEIWPSLIDIKDIKKQPNGQVSSWQWVYKLPSTFPTSVWLRKLREV